MRPFHNTPTCYSAPTKKEELAGRDLLIDLENRYADYRDACNKGYCKSDPAVHAKFIADIAAAREATGN
jgi:hypothetical protein